MVFLFLQQFPTPSSKQNERFNMNIETIEQAIKTRDTTTLLQFQKLITNGLSQILQDKPQIGPATITPPKTDTSGLKKRVTNLALSFIERGGKEGKVKFLNEIIVPTLGEPKTFADCTIEDLDKLETRLLELEDA
ncbi:MAG: hypothetical protein DBO98_03310 [Candidatus Liberibacter europaeus]|nr:hypothetical protein [Candidatus Liberibacter europaeus]